MSAEAYAQPSLYSFNLTFFFFNSVLKISVTVYRVLSLTLSSLLLTSLAVHSRSLGITKARRVIKFRIEGTLGEVGEYRIAQIFYTLCSFAPPFPLFNSFLGTKSFFFFSNHFFRQFFCYHTFVPIWRLVCNCLHALYIPRNRGCFSAMCFC